MRGSGRIIAQRRQKLIQLLEREGGSKVLELRERLGVSEITIRRDLEELADEGLVERYHGGARLKDRPVMELLYEDKSLLHAATKNAIGAAAAALVSERSTILLNAGSTALAVLHHLRDRSLRVVTNNAAAPAEIGGSNVELILLGGEYRAKSRSLFGDFAALTLSQVHASMCILGVNGVSAKTGLTFSVYTEAAINRLMAERCNGEVVVVADGTKVGTTSNFACVPISRVHVLVTDASADPQELAAIEASGVRVIVVQTA
ncbi:MAG TPA: DeoR/GlpR family DNA-binding transcription regulator [Rectinemataceae bacterium]|nr:DeoR/GlpR family DNA-binding transcription regulator [Rectinemataceae bacterium]